MGELNNRLNWFYFSLITASTGCSNILSNHNRPVDILLRSCKWRHVRLTSINNAGREKTISGQKRTTERFISSLFISCMVILTVTLLYLEQCPVKLPLYDTISNFIEQAKEE